MTKSMTSAATAAAANAASVKPILAERFKTKACQKFDETGACPYETRCMFAHGEHDLRTKEQNIADNLVTEEAIKAFQKARAIAAKSAQKKRERDEKRKAKRAAVSPAATPSDEEQEEAVAPVTAEELEEDVALPTQEEVSPVSVPTVSPSASPRKPSVTYDTTKFVSPLAAAMLSQRKVVSEECHCALCAAGEAHHDAAILLA